MRVLESDLFEEPIHGEDVLVCPVNLVGVMGKGLALTFKQRYPEIVNWYESALENRTLAIGKNSKVYCPQYPQIMFLATKRHWRDKSQKEDVIAGLLDLRSYVRRYPNEHIRLPAVGCGEGGLSFLWLEEQCWTLFSGCNVDLFRPK